MHENLHKISEGGPHHSVRAAGFLVCGGRAPQRRRFSVGDCQFQSGVALCFPPQSKKFLASSAWFVLFLLFGVLLSATQLRADEGLNLVSAEYFWDTDPGVGNGTNITIQSGETFAIGFPSTNSWSVDIGSLPAGLHKLGFRILDATNRWSDVAWLPIQVQDATNLLAGVTNTPISDANNLLVAAEYFWNTDPGVGNGTPVAVQPGQTFTTNLLNVDISALNAGLHKLGFRTRDASSRWSEINWLPIQVQDTTNLLAGVTNTLISDANYLLVAAEYFWDSDPGAGNGTNVIIPAGETFAIGSPTTNLLNVDISSLNAGLHKLGFRARDASSRWSEINWLPVQVQDVAGLLAGVTSLPLISDAANHLVFAEYFWDADPGLSNGVPVSFPAGETYAPGGSPLPTLNIPVPRLPLGEHYLSVRVRDASGRWATNQTGLVLDRQTEFQLATAITVSTNSSTNSFTISNTPCPGPGQICANTFDLPVTTHSVLRVQFTAQTGAYSDVRVHFWVDGTNHATSVRLVPGAASGWFDLGPLASGLHLLQVQAEGFLGNHNVGTLNSWAGSLQVVTSSLATNISGGDFTHTAGGANGLAVADYNGDSYPDIFQTSPNENGVLFLNDKQGAMNRANLPTLLSATNGQSAAWADYDNDGWLDLFMTTADRMVADRNLLYRNLGGTNFTLLAVTNMPSAQSNSAGVAWADVDGDGFVDFAIASTTGTRIELYRNNGDGTFASLSTSSNLLSGAAQAVAFGDFDNDGRPDLVSAGSGGVHIFRNFGTNQFLELIGTGLASDTTEQSVAWADYDNDGWLDLFVASSNHLGALFHNNATNWTFTQVQISTFNVPGFGATACAWADYDQDGRQDLFVSSGATNNASRLFHNNPSGIFNVMTNGPVAAPLGVYAGSAWADMDRNGTPDLLVANRGSTNLLYQNVGSGAGWLRVKLSGRPSNKAAIGAKVKVLANIDGESFWQLQEVSGGSGYASQGELPLTFGLGDATNISSVVIEWPSGLDTVYTNLTSTNLPIAQVLTVSELPEGQPVITVGAEFHPDGQYRFVSLDPVTVTIDSPFQNGFVFYTTDGSEPDFTANWYTGPFEISPPAVIQAVAYDEALTTNKFGESAQLILVPTFFLTNSTPGGGDFTLAPPGPNYLSNTVVTAVATSEPGWTFLNWAGSLAGTNPTNTFPMDSDKNVIAVFGSSLSVTALGGTTFGIVSNTPAAALHPFASTPRLTAVPAAGKYFVRWGLSGATATNLTDNPMDWPMTNASPSFIALLANLPTNNYSLTVIKNGQGSVTRNPNASFYTNGVAVTLTAVPLPGEFFLGWSGDVTSPQNPITVTMNASKIIAANFGLMPPVFSFSAASYEVNEAAGTVMLAVRNNGVPGTVDFATVNGSAVGGNGSAGDYVSTNGTLTFAYGETNRSIAICIREQYLLGADKTFQVQLSNPTGGSGSLTNPATATVVIHFNDAVTTNGSLLVQAAPAQVPDRSGSLRVTLMPPLPAVNGGFWRFSWELAWRPGELATNLMQDYYDVEFRQIPGYQVATITNQLVFANAPPTEVTNQYIAIGPSGVGRLTVQIGPNNPVVTTNAGWRLLGETAWRGPGSTATNLAPGNEVVEFKPVVGLAAPSAREVAVFADQESVIFGYYELPATLPPGAALPTPLPSLSFINDSFTNSPRLPYTFNGQLQTDLGVGSGVTALSNVVLSAAHVVFNDATLSYVGSVSWFFQKQTGELDPNPQPARGWYVLSGYAAARTNDLPPFGSLSPGVSSAPSRNVDVAAIYFLAPAGRGGFGGYLSSDLPVNEWLTSTQPKLIVGYPLDGTPFSYANVVKGKMHAVVASNYSFTLQSNRVYTTTGFLNFPGNSGGPVYVLCTNNVYYPAAVYLGTVANASAVRAIDSDVVSLLNLAQLSATFGDEGTNFTGGGVIRVVSSATSGSGVGYLQVRVGPPAALTAGGGWRLSGDTVYSSNPNFTRSISNGSNFAIEFAPAAGWMLPPDRTVTVPLNQLTVIDANYSVAPPVFVMSVGGIGMTGTSNTSYRIEYRTNLAVGAWLPLRTNTLVSGFDLIAPLPPTNGWPVAFYRAVWLP